MFPPSMHQFLDDIFNIEASKNWYMLGGNFFSAHKKIWQIGIFYYFYGMF